MHRQTLQLHPRSPVLARTGAAIQVGIGSPVVLRGLGSEERAFVASLEGGRPVSPAQARRFSRVVTRLTNAGAWWEAPAGPPDTATVAVHGCGRLGMAIASAVADLGLRVALHDEAPRAVEEPGLYTGPFALDDETLPGTCAGAAALTLAQRGVPVCVGGTEAALAIVTCCGSPDPALVGELMRTDTPHVVVACTELDVWVSHVIVPGASACSRCRDVALSCSDPDWPLIALQLADSRHHSRRPHAGAVARHVVVGLVCSTIGGWLAAGDPGSGRLVGAEGTFADAPIAPEPACGCGAAPAVSQLVPVDDLEDVRSV